MKKIKDMTKDELREKYYQVTSVSNILDWVAIGIFVFAAVLSAFEHNLLSVAGHISAAIWVWIANSRLQSEVKESKLCDEMSDAIDRFLKDR